MHLVRTYVEVRHFRKQVAGLADKLPKNGLSLGALHVAAESSGEGGAVTRHVNLRNHQDMMPLAEIQDVPHLILSVEASGIAGRDLRGVDPGIDFAFKPPGLVLSQMPMECVDLVPGKDLYLMLQLLRTDERAPGVVHEASDFERRPVRDVAARNPDTRSLPFIQLPQRLDSPEHTVFRNRLHTDGFRRDNQPVGLILIDGGLVDPVHQRDLNHRGSRPGAFDSGLLKPFTHSAGHREITGKAHATAVKHAFVPDNLPRKGKQRDSVIRHRRRAA